MMRNQLTLEQFQQTELAANFNKVFQNKKLPFKYKTFYYLQKILYSKEVEADINEFRNKEHRVRQKWMYSDLMQKDINRTKHLKDNPNLHEDVKRVVEYYCASQNVMYCQGMLEVLLPFLYMKQIPRPESDTVSKSSFTSNQNCFDLACVYGFFKRFVR